jgi:hypothetical protein
MPHASIPGARGAKNQGLRSLDKGEGRDESDISQVFSVDDICRFWMDISRNHQGESVVRSTLTAFYLPIQIIDPLHGLYVADLMSLYLSQRRSQHEARNSLGKKGSR